MLNKKRIIKVAVSLISFLGIMIFVLIKPNNDIDNYIRDFFVEIRNDLLTNFFKIYTDLCEPIVVIILIGLIILIIRKWRYNLLVIFNISVSFLLNVLIKEIVNRERPHETIRLVVETSSSFPSGHSMSGCAIYLMIGYLLTLRYPNYNKLIKIFSGMIVVMLVISRLYLGVHYFTDTIAGVSLGYMVYNVSLLCFEYWKPALK